MKIITEKHISPSVILDDIMHWVWQKRDNKIANVSRSSRRRRKLSNEQENIIQQKKKIGHEIFLFHSHALVFDNKTRESLLEKNFLKDENTIHYCLSLAVRIWRRKKHL